MKYKVGDKLICITSLDNWLGDELYNKDDTYNVLNVFDDEVTIFITLNHKLIGNEYSDLPEYIINENFVNKKELRKMKLKKLNNAEN